MWYFVAAMSKQVLHRFFQVKSRGLCQDKVKGSCLKGIDTLNDQDTLETEHGTCLITAWPSFIMMMVACSSCWLLYLLFVALALLQSQASKYLVYNIIMMASNDVIFLVNTTQALSSCILQIWKTELFVMYYEYHLAMSRGKGMLINTGLVLRLASLEARSKISFRK